MTLIVTADSDAYINWLIAHDTEVDVSWVRRCVLQRDSTVSHLRRHIYRITCLQCLT